MAQVVLFHLYEKLLHGEVVFVGIILDNLKATGPIWIPGSSVVTGVPLIGKSYQCQTHVMVVGQIHTVVRAENGGNRMPP